MPIRFSTEAANADHMRMDNEPAVPEGTPEDVGADGTPRDRADRAGRREPRGGALGEQESDAPAKPGKDINAPGFVKDRDAGKP
jgi:hypothetical protein